MQTCHAPASARGLVLASGTIALLFALASPTLAHTITGDITCDNYFVIYTAANETPGMTVNFTGIRNCHPGSSVVNLNTTDRYLYIACWSDHAVAQGLMHDLNVNGTNVFSGDPVWRVTYTNSGLNLGSGCDSPPAGLPIALQQTIPSPPGGWILPAAGCMNTPPGELCYFAWGHFAAIDMSARRIWYDSGLQTGDNAPFQPGFNHNEYLIFRLDMSAICRDSIPPGPALPSVSCTPDSLGRIVQWTAPSDESSTPTGETGECAPSTGPVASYDIRWATTPILDEADFTAANQVVGEPVPATPGTVQSFTFPAPRGTIYIAMRTRDHAFNGSSLSTVVTTCGCADSEAPAAAAGLSVTCSPDSTEQTIQWVAPADPSQAIYVPDGQCHPVVRRVSRYDLRWSYLPITTEADYEAAEIVYEVPLVPNPPGTTESMTIDARGSAHFALRSYDDAGNESPMTTAFNHCNDTVAVPNELPPGFGIAQVRPNPSRRGPVQVAFRLPSVGPGRIELLDVRGRLVARHDLVSSVVGDQVVRLGNDGLPAGVYVVRLTQGGAIDSKMAIVLGR